MCHMCEWIIIGKWNSKTCNSACQEIFGDTNTKAFFITCVRLGMSIIERLTQYITTLFSLSYSKKIKQCSIRSRGTFVLSLVSPSHLWIVAKFFCSTISRQSLCVFLVSQFSSDYALCQPRDFLCFMKIHLQLWDIICSEDIKQMCVHVLYFFTTALLLILLKVRIEQWIIDE